MGDTHDRVVLAVERRDAAERVLGAAEFLLPETMAYDSHPMVSALALFFPESASNGQRFARQGEESGAHLEGLDPHRLARAHEVVARGGAPD